MAEPDFSKNEAFLIDAIVVVESEEIRKGLVDTISKLVGWGPAKAVPYRQIKVFFDDFQVGYNGALTRPQDVLNYILEEVPYGLAWPVAPLLAWLSYYHAEEAREFYKKIENDQRVKVPFRQYVGMPGDRAKVRRGQAIKITPTGTQTAPQSPQPRLSAARLHEHWAHYSNRKIEILGRDAERAALREFADTKPGFRWLQLAGEGGQGKSCLAQDLIQHQKAQDWKAGFLLDGDRKAFAESWGEWHPDTPHLIVFDYVVGATAEIGAIMHALARRSREFRVPIRVLLLERQRWDRGGWRLQREAEGRGGTAPPFALSEERALWFDEMQGHGSDHSLAHPDFVDDRRVIELTALPQARLVEIVDRLFSLAQLPQPHTSEFIAEALEKIDRSGRPLYAYFLAQALMDGRYRNGWDRDDLLDYVLETNRQKRWKVAFNDEVPVFDAEHPALRLALLATMLADLDCGTLENDQSFGVAKPDQETLKQSLAITDGPVGKPGLFGQMPSLLMGLQPDILGEYFILKAWENGLLPEKLVQLAWSLKPSGMTAFLQRLAEDFPESAAANEILAIHPATEVSAAYTAMTPYIGFAMVSAGRIPPDPVIDQLQRAADENLPNAKLAMALLYSFVGNWPMAALTFEQVAHDDGNASAMYNIGVCYEMGRGVAPDPVRAAYWYRKGMDGGDISATYELGRCSANAIGTPVDFVTAAECFSIASSRGHIPATFDLGVLFDRGLGVRCDPAAAVQCFQRAADAGYAKAMFNLGDCIMHGRGVDAPDPEQAVRLYRAAAERGVVEAMVNLGSCLMNGIGVPQRDPAQAVVWYEMAARAGDANAKFLLAVAHTSDEHFRLDYPTALAWFIESGNAGIAEAMFNVGICYARGLGTEPDLVKAEEWCQRARRAGYPC